MSSTVPDIALPEDKEEKTSVGEYLAAKIQNRKKELRLRVKNRVKAVPVSEKRKRQTFHCHENLYFIWWPARQEQAAAFYVKNKHDDNLMEECPGDLIVTWHKEMREVVLLGLQNLEMDTSESDMRYLILHKETCSQASGVSNTQIAVHRNGAIKLYTHLMDQVNCPHSFGSQSAKYSISVLKNNSLRLPLKVWLALLEHIEDHLLHPTDELWELEEEDENEQQQEEEQSTAKRRNIGKLTDGGRIVLF